MVVVLLVGVAALALTAFAIPFDQLLIFLRQDRDAGRTGDAA